MNIVHVILWKVNLEEYMLPFDQFMQCHLLLFHHEHNAAVWKTDLCMYVHTYSMRF